MYMVAGVVVVVVIAGILLAYSGNIFGYGTQKQTSTESQQTIPTAREPSLSVSSQVLSGSDVVVDSLYLDKSGFVVIHKDANGAPGAVIGHSDLISGEKTNLKVAIDSSQAGSKVFAMLHYDDNSNGVYEFPQEDKPVKLADNVVVKPVTITQQAAAAPAEQPAQTAAQEFSLEADDAGYYMNGAKVTSIDVKKDSKAKITFQVRTTNVAFGGLDFRSTQFNIDTKKVEPGESSTVEFTADKSGTIISHWPSSNIPKASLQVNSA